MLASRNRAQLLVVDIQEKLAPAVDGAEQVIGNTGRLISFARRLGIPMLFTEQYPRGLGPTIPALLGLAGNEAPRLDKTEFSVWRNEGIRKRIAELAQTGRREIVVTGMEAHVCVLQSAMDLVANELEVFVVADAVSSRAPGSRELAVQRLGQAGVGIVNTEMIAFEWLERAGSPEFKDLIGLIK